MKLLIVFLEIYHLVHVSVLIVKELLHILCDAFYLMSRKHHMTLLLKL